MGRVRIQRLGQVKRTRRKSFTVGWVPQWCTPNTDIDTVLTGLKERLYFVRRNGEYVLTPKPWDHHTLNHLSELEAKNRAFEFIIGATEGFVSKVVEEAKKLNNVPGDRFMCVSAQEFVNDRPQRIRKRYAAAAELYDQRGFSPKDGEIRVFIKDEYNKPGGSPRLIQPRGEVFNLCLGRYISQLEHPIFTGITEAFPWNRRNSLPVVAKGFNQKERGTFISSMWHRFKDPVAVGLDLSRCDQHINHMLLKVEHEVYTQLCEERGMENEPLRQLLQYQLKNKGKFRGEGGRLDYVVLGSRMSGDMNTSMGNVIIVTAVFHSYLKQLRMLDRVGYFNDGDDAVVILNRKDLEAFSSGIEDHFLKFGLTMVVEGVFEQLEHITFCQSKPVWFPSGYRMVPNPHKRLFSDVVTNKNIDNAKIRQKWIGAVAGCGLAESGDVPLFSAFYMNLAKVSHPWIPDEHSTYYKYRDRLISRMKIRRTMPHPRTRASFAEAHDVPVDLQLSLEPYLLNREFTFEFNPDGPSPNVHSRCLDPVQKEGTDYGHLVRIADN